MAAGDTTVGSTPISTAFLDTAILNLMRFALLRVWIEPGARLAAVVVDEVLLG
jgi:hypothetical protein